MMLLVLIYHYLFSGNARAVSSILKTMCINKELIGWENVNPTLDTSLCKEPLPLNRSGETPLEVARKAGHHEEIRQVYEGLGLPTTIKEQLWIARCTAVMKKNADKTKADTLAYIRASNGTLPGQAPLTYPTQPIMPNQPFAYPPQPLAYFLQGQQPLAYYPQGQQPLPYHPQGQQPLAYYNQGQQPLTYHPQGQQPLAYHPQGQQPLAYYNQG